MVAMEKYVFMAIAAVAALAIAAVFVLFWKLVKTKASLEARTELDDARTKELAAGRELLKSEFARLAASLLGENKTELAKENADSVKTLFADLKEKLDQYGKSVAAAAADTNRLGVEMQTHVKSLAEFSKYARDFTSALMGGTKTQGDFGEEILAGLLEQSGLVENVHYELQKGNASEGRPDLRLFDILNHHVLLVDAKMNIKSYIEACSLPDDAAHRPLKAQKLKAHAQSIREQIKSLAARNYPEKTSAPEGYRNLPLVAMFCPFHNVLEAAIVEDPSLMQEAYSRGIAIVTPLTLLGYFWLVSQSWKNHDVEQKFVEIQKLGGDVVAALDMMLDDIDKAAKAIGNAQTCIESLSNRVNSEKGKVSVRRIAIKLMECGVKPAKLKQIS